MSEACLPKAIDYLQHLAQFQPTVMSFYLLPNNPVMKCASNKHEVAFSCAEASFAQY